MAEEKMSKREGKKRERKKDKDVEIEVSEERIRQVDETYIIRNSLSPIQMSTLRMKQERDIGQQRDANSVGLLQGQNGFLSSYHKSKTSCSSSSGASSSVSSSSTNFANENCKNPEHSREVTTPTIHEDLNQYDENELYQDGEQPIQEEQLRRFKHVFRQRIEHIVAKRVSYVDVPKEFRRLDSIARLLECNSTCAAVYYHKPTKTLFLFNNKVYNNSHDKNEYIDNMKDVFELISNESLSLETIFMKLANIISLNIVQEKWRYLEKLKLKGLELNRDKLRKIITNCLEDMFQSGLETKIWIDNFLSSFTEISDEKFSIMLIRKVSKITRDFLKLRDFLLTSYRQETFSSEILLAIQQKRFKIAHIESKDVHAEMRVLSYIVRNLTLQNDYIGISKLCCDHCALAIDAFDKRTRGLHGQRTKWPLPNFLRKSQNCLKQYMGENAFSLYMGLDRDGKKEAIKFIESKEASSINETATHGRYMYADSSESDVEVGPNFEDDEDKTAEISGLPLAKIWTLRDIQFHYSDELEFLLSDIGLSLNEVIELYEQSIDKFKRVTSDDVIAFIDCYKFDQDSSQYEVFEKISGIYDEDEELFNAIIENEDSLVSNYGIEDFADKYYSSIAKHGGRHHYSDGDDIDHIGAAQAEIREENGWDYESNSNDSENRCGSGKSNSEEDEDLLEDDSLESAFDRELRFN